jgi:hypothetical protein
VFKAIDVLFGASRSPFAAASICPAWMLRVRL